MEPDPQVPGIASTAAELNQEPNSRRAAARQELENLVTVKTGEADGTREAPVRQQWLLRISAVEESSKRGSPEEVEEIEEKR